VEHGSLGCTEKKKKFYTFYLLNGEANVFPVCSQMSCGLLHKAGFSCYPGKFKISLSKLWFFGFINVDQFLAGFIALVTYATWLTCSGADFILG